MFGQTNPNSMCWGLFQFAGFLIAILSAMLEKRNVGDSSTISFGTHNKDLIPIYSRKISGNEMLIVEGVLGALVALLLLTKKSRNY